MTIHAAIENAIARSETMRREEWISRMRDKPTCCLQATKMVYKVEEKTFLCLSCGSSYKKKGENMIKE